MSLGVKEFAVPLSIKNSQENTTKKLGLNSKYSRHSEGSFIFSKKADLKENLFLKKIKNCWFKGTILGEKN